MRLILLEDRQGLGKYRDIDLSTELPNLSGLRIKEFTFTARDKHWLSTHVRGTDWMIDLIRTRMAPYHG